MSSFTYVWNFDTRKDLNEILKDNKKFFKEQIDNSISHVMEMIKNTKSTFLDYSLIENLERYKKDFLEKYTLEILSSENHTQWVDVQIAKLQDIVRKTKEYIILVKTELTDNLDVQTLKTFLNALPEGVQETTKKIQKIIELFENLEKEFKNPAANRETIELYLNMFPEELRNIKFYRTMKYYAEILHDIEKCTFDTYSTVEKLNKYLQEIPSEYYGIVRKIKQKLLEQKTIKIKEQIERERITEKEIVEVIEKQRILEKIEAVFDKLKAINPELAEEKRQLVVEAAEIDDIQRIRLILEDLKMNYINTRRLYIQTQVLKNDLKVFEKLAEETGMQKEFNKLKNMSILNREEVDNFIKNLLNRKRQIMDQERRRGSLEKFINKVMELGYSVIKDDLIGELSTGKIVEIKTPFGEDYMLRLKYEDDGLKIMFVRYVEDEKNLSEYEKRRDIAIAKKWCSDYEKIKQLLSQEGITIEDKIRIEPETRFYYIKREKAEITNKQQDIKKIDMQKRQRSV